MPYYSYLKYDFRNNGERAFVIENIQRLQRQLEKDIPEKNIENNLLLATWNIRDFDKTNRRGFGKRSKQSLYYIAEIISRFDLVAVQEVNSLDELEKVMRILGSDWDYIATDVADIRAGGNGERMTFIYDTRKVWFKNIAGEIVLPPNLLISKTELEIEQKKVVAGKQFRRTPFIVAFQSNWFKFNLCTVHIYYGQDSGEKLRERKEEIAAIASYLSKRAERELRSDHKATLLLGDFNIVHPEHETMKALEENGFTIPEKLKRPANINLDKYYDQIAFRCSPELIESINEDLPDGRKKAGVFEFFRSVYRPEDYRYHEAELKKSSNSRSLDAAGRKIYYEIWRTYQMSDHNLMWVQLPTNNSRQYLEALKER